MLCFNVVMVLHPGIDLEKLDMNGFSGFGSIETVSSGDEFRLCLMEFGRFCCREWAVVCRISVC